MRKCDIICHMKDLMYFYKKAIKKGFALGAFNFSNLETLKAICSAAEEEKSPVIVAISEGALKFLGEGYIFPIVNQAKKEYKAPIFLHLDHGKSFEICKKAVDLGFDSVMIDASDLSFDKNIEVTKKVVNYAHKKEVYVEAELGQIKGIEDEISVENNHFTDPIQAKIFVEKTNVDSLAVAIGTSHGAYKYKGKSELKFDILSNIQKQLKNFPLVLHGASSVNQELVKNINKLGGKINNAVGVDENLIRIAVTKYNIVKINMDTDLRIAYTEAIMRSLKNNPSNFDPRVYIKEAQTAVKNVVKNKMKNLLNSSNKA